MFSRINKQTQQMRGIRAGGQSCHWLDFIVSVHQLSLHDLRILCVELLINSARQHTWDRSRMQPRGEDADRVLHCHPPLYLGGGAVTAFSVAAKHKDKVD